MISLGMIILGSCAIGWLSTFIQQSYLDCLKREQIREERQLRSTPHSCCRGGPESFQISQNETELLSIIKCYETYFDSAPKAVEEYSPIGEKIFNEYFEDQGFELWNNTKLPLDHEEFHRILHETFMDGFSIGVGEAVRFSQAKNSNLDHPCRPINSKNWLRGKYGHDMAETENFNEIQPESTSDPKKPKNEEPSPIPSSPAEPLPEHLTEKLQHRPY